jgi:hypothetical protein
LVGERFRDAKRQKRFSSRSRKIGFRWSQNSTFSTFGDFLSPNASIFFKKLNNFQSGQKSANGPFWNQKRRARRKKLRRFQKVEIPRTTFKGLGATLWFLVQKVG